LAKKIPLPLLVLLARKTSHVEELTVKLEAVFATDREGRPDGLIYNDIRRQQSLVRVEHKHTSQRRCSLGIHAAICQCHYQEDCGTETKKSHNPYRWLRHTFTGCCCGKTRHGFLRF